MEPSDLNHPDDAQLESLLRLASAAAPLADDGFSERVLAALPPPKRLPLVSRRVLLCSAGALAGLLLAFVQGGNWSSLAAVATQARDLAIDSDALLTGEWPWLAVAVAIGAGAFALLSDREPTANGRF